MALIQKLERIENLLDQYYVSKNALIKKSEKAHQHLEHFVDTQNLTKVNILKATIHKLGLMIEAITNQQTLFNNQKEKLKKLIKTEIHLKLMNTPLTYTPFKEGLKHIKLG